MTVTYELRYFHPDGTAGEIGQGGRGWTKFSLAYGVNGVGELVILFPYTGRSDYYKRWGTCEVWRSVNGVARLEGNRLWRLQAINDLYDVGRRRWVQLRFLDDNALLTSRIIYAAAGSAEAEKTDLADDMLRAIVREQAGKRPSRALTTWLTVEADTSTGQSLSWAGAYQPMLQELQDICKQSTAAGYPLFFDCVRTSSTTSQFRVFSGQRGTNRGSDSGQAVVVTVDGGTLQEPVLSLDWRDEKDFIVAAGQGEGTARIIATYPATDPDDILGRSEYFVDARDIEVDDAAGLLARAKAAWEKYRTHVRFSGKIAETREWRYGRDFFYGDKLVVKYHNWTGDVHIRTVQIDVDELNSETLTLGINNYD